MAVSDSTVTHVRLHFENAAGDEDELFGPSGLLDAHRARTDAGDQRRVARIDAELAGLAGQRDELGLAREDLLLGADDVDVMVCAIVRCVMITRQTFLAFSNASSIVPTM